MVLNAILGTLALLSLALTLWQWLAARRFPLHQRLPPVSPLPPCPALSLLKPLKGCDVFTEDCLRSWLVQHYPGPVQILFGIASADDPAGDTVRKLLREFPAADAQLVVCGPLTGANAKVSQLVRLEQLAKHEVLIISDADVRVPPDLLGNLIPPLVEPPCPPDGEEAAGRAQAAGLVCCFYRLANAVTLAMQWEAVAINADFWSQVLQARSLKPIDFALGAVMALRRSPLEAIGGFQALRDHLADDYQLGNRLARRGHPITLCPVVVECCSAPMDWIAVGQHQLRWARTIRVCQPVPYFFSILSNPTLWPLLWLAVNSCVSVFAFAGFALLVRSLTARHLQHRLNPHPTPGSQATVAPAWLVPVKDLLQAAIWLMAFIGNRIKWRGQQFRLRRDGTLEPRGTAG